MNLAVQKSACTSFLQNVSCDVRKRKITAVLFKKKDEKLVSFSLFTVIS